MANSRITAINSSRFQKRAAVLITKKFEEIAENTKANVQLVIADKLEETYINELKASYSARSERGKQIEVYNAKQKEKEQEPYYKKQRIKLRRQQASYHHHTDDALAKQVHAQIDENYVKIVVDDMTYANGKKAEDILTYLSKGTMGGSRKGGPGTYKGEDGNWYYNYPTPRHLFEEHTKAQMQGFLASLESDIRNGKYSTFRYTGKKKSRDYYTYKGERINLK